MGNHVFVYRMTSDSGNAPCVSDISNAKTQTLSLACCKGGHIRKDKPIACGMRYTIGRDYPLDKNNVYVVGVNKDCILYAAKITEVITVNNYYSEGSHYRDRKDCIYTYYAESNHNDTDSLCKSFKRREDHNTSFHFNDDKQLKRDISGGYVLLSNEFSYFGDRFNDYKICEDYKPVFPKYRETKHFSDNSDNVNVDNLISYIRELIEKSEIGNPIGTNNKCKSKCGEDK